MGTKMNVDQHDEYRYLLKCILEIGDVTPNRTGIPCLKVFNQQFAYMPEQFPFSTDRPLGIKNAWKEMKFFLSGETDSTLLEDQGINYWKAHTSREFLDSRGLHHLPTGSMGASYSKQFRNILTPSLGIHDQVAELIEGLKNDPYGRRHAIDLWGVADQELMPLLPCWFRSSWSVQMMGEGIKPRLLLKLYSRSNDIVFGYYQAVMQYRLFHIALANLLDMDLGVMIVDLWDVHIYMNQIEYAKEILSRECGTTGTVVLSKKVNSLEDILALEPEDFIVTGYNPNRDPFVTPRPDLAV